MSKLQAREKLVMRCVCMSMVRRKLW